MKSLSTRQVARTSGIERAAVEGPRQQDKTAGFEVALTAHQNNYCVNPPSSTPQARLGGVLQGNLRAGFKPNNHCGTISFTVEGAGPRGQEHKRGRSGCQALAKVRRASKGGPEEDEDLLMTRVPPAQPALSEGMGLGGGGNGRNG